MRSLPALFLLAASFAARAAEPPVPPPPALAATAWVLVDQQSGQVLAGQRAEEATEPASITKLMTAYAVFHALREGKLKLDTQLPISERAWRIVATVSEWGIESSGISSFGSGVSGSAESTKYAKRSVSRRSS